LINVSKIRDSWFNTNQLDRPIVLTEVTETKLRCKQVRLYPTPKQTRLLKDWLSVYKAVYNFTVNYIKTNRFTLGISKIYSSCPKLRDFTKKNFPINLINRIKLTKMPAHCVDQAIYDVSKAYKSALALQKTTKKRFRIRSKRDTSSNSMVIEENSFSETSESFYPKSLGIMKSVYIENGIKITNNLKGIKHSCRLVLNNSEFTLYVPTDKVIKQVESKLEKCSLDPGLRTFQTAYVKDNDIATTFEIGSNLTSTLSPIISKINKAVENKVNKKYIRRLRDKVKHKVTDLHWKVAKQLASTYKTILIGDIGTKSIVSNERSNLRPETKQLIHAVSFYTFKQRLASKCDEYGTTLHIVNESYTSKTCGKCGELTDVGSSKLYKCSKCKFEIDRDVNGARNIMIKHETLIN
jgi:IS605 OrfB family transposase